MLPSIYRARIQLFDDLLKNDDSSDWFERIKNIAFKEAKFDSTCTNGCQHQRLIDIFVYKFREKEDILGKFFRSSFKSWSEIETFIKEIPKEEYPRQDFKKHPQLKQELDSVNQNFINLDDLFDNRENNNYVKQIQEKDKLISELERKLEETSQMTSYESEKELKYKDELISELQQKVVENSEQIKYFEEQIGSFESLLNNSNQDDDASKENTDLKPRKFDRRYAKVIPFKSDKEIIEFFNIKENALWFKDFIKAQFTGKSVTKCMKKILKKSYMITRVWDNYNMKIKRPALPEIFTKFFEAIVWDVDGFADYENDPFGWKQKLRQEFRNSFKKDGKNLGNDNESEFILSMDPLDAKTLDDFKHTNVSDMNIEDDIKSDDWKTLEEDTHDDLNTENDGKFLTDLEDTKNIFWGTEVIGQKEYKKKMSTSKPSSQNSKMEVLVKKKKTPVQSNLNFDKELRVKLLRNLPFKSDEDIGEYFKLPESREYFKQYVSYNFGINRFMFAIRRLLHKNYRATRLWDENPYNSNHGPFVHKLFVDVFEEFLEDYEEELLAQNINWKLKLRRHFVECRDVSKRNARKNGENKPLN